MTVMTDGSIPLEGSKGYRKRDRINWRIECGVYWKTHVGIHQEELIRLIVRTHCQWAGPGKEGIPNWIREEFYLKGADVWISISRGFRYCLDVRPIQGSANLGNIAVSEVV